MKDMVSRFGISLMHGAGAALASGAVAWIVWLAVARPPASVEVTAASRFVAYAFAVMGLAWLIGPILLGRFDMPGVFRWGGWVDGAGIALLAGAILSDAVAWPEGLKLYAILACFATMQLSLGWLVYRLVGLAKPPAEPDQPPRQQDQHPAPPKQPERLCHRPALAGIVLAVLAMTTLVWGHLPERLFRTGSPGDRAVLAVVRYANPLLAANDAINPPTRFDWSKQHWMYSQYGIIGEARLLRLPDWRLACAIHLLAGAVLAGLAIPLRRRPVPAIESGRSNVHAAGNDRSQNTPLSS